MLSEMCSFWVWLILFSAMEIPTESARKQKKLTSVVWNHFERIRKGETCFAVCVHCNKRLSGSSNSGTTHLRNHLMRCLKRSNFDVSQLLVAKRRKIDTTNTNSSAVTLSGITYDEAQRKDDFIKPAIVKFDQDHHQLKKEEILGYGTRRFDQDRSRSDLARMIILHGYPLSMVDHVGFQVFVKNLQPMFEVVPGSEVRFSCMEIYEKERARVSGTIREFHGRVNVSVETFTCSQENSEYLCLTAHYVDDDWRLQSKIVNFVALDYSSSLSEVIVKCLVDWGIDGKIFALTFDDSSIDDEIVLEIKVRIGQLKRREPIDLCCALHVLKSLVRDCVESLRDPIQKIRESFGYVKSSQVMLGKFDEIAQQVGIAAGQRKKLVLDFPGRWDTTHLMIQTASEHRTVFSLFRDHEPSYADSSLTDAEWESVESVSGFLHLFSEIASALSTNKDIYFPEICDVHVKIIEWSKSADGFVSSVAIKMKEKFDRYWSKCGLTLAMGAILDPRFKLKLVEYYYSQIYGSTAQDRIKEVFDGIRALFDTYSIGDEGSDLPGTSSGNNSEPRDRLRGFDKFLHETSQSQSSESDLDKYLEEPVFPRSCDFNLLNWWKVHTPRYPILSMVARDLLGTPVTLSPELAFSSGVRVLDQSRSSLSPDMLEALICTQDWLRSEPLDLAPLGIHSARPLHIEPS